MYIFLVISVQNFCLVLILSTYQVLYFLGMSASEMILKGKSDKVFGLLGFCSVEGSSIVFGFWFFSVAFKAAR